MSVEVNPAKASVIGVGAREPEERLPHLVALEKGNRVRMFRAKKKYAWKQLGRQAAAGEIAAVLLDIPDEMRTMNVFDLLCACPGVGPTKARRWLKGLKMSPHMRLEQLDGPRRLELIRRLRP